ncbi:hypothetical protein Hypma_014447 [Hypsizygus marmoreus]|uniref:Uncharacterized protein n=1 Tax=Hypsizygus marmoreus TaxID=39966 RepID=A0A369JJJ9_HYPMA|nr:hypothetical protein Hypma_014447 [Hypsizygus marmoreus]
MLPPIPTPSPSSSSARCTGPVNKHRLLEGEVVAYNSETRSGGVLVSMHPLPVYAASWFSSTTSSLPVSYPHRLHL